MKLLLPIPCSSCQGYYALWILQAKTRSSRTSATYNDGEVQVGMKERAEDEQGSGLRILDALRRQVSQWPSAQGISGKRIYSVQL
jgi:hypothetical protein